MFTLKARKVGLNCLAFSPDGRLLAASGYRGVVQVWDLAARKLALSIQAGAYDITTVFFSHDAREVHYLKDGVLYATSLRGPERVCGAARRHAHAAAASADCRRVCLWFGSGPEAYSLPAFECLWKKKATAGPNWTTALSYSRDGRRLAAGLTSGEVGVRDAATGEPLHERLPGLAAEVKGVALSPDGHAIAWCVASHLYLYRLPSPGVAEQIAHHSFGRTFFLSVAFHPSGGFLATVNGDGKVDFWDAGTGERREAFDWGVGKLHDVAFDPTGDRAACCAKTGEIVVWDVER